MQRGEVLREERLLHLQKLTDAGIDSFPAYTQRDRSIAEARDASGQIVKIAGRVMAIRSHGKALFADLLDESGKIQVYAKADTLPDQFSQLELVDVGDFLSIQGEIFTTKMGEITVSVTDAKILAKAIRPLPSQWYGLKDAEERFRRRYIDLLLNPESKHIFTIRQKLFRSIRRFLESNNFFEVETPILQSVYGGASAKPFMTRYNAYDLDVYLRIAPELYLKRLLVAGYERVFEIGRCFRNEGADPTHNPEFTMLEFYAAYWDETYLMDFTEELIMTIVSDVMGHTELLIDGKSIPLTKPFVRKTFAEITNGHLTDEHFKEAVKKIIEPTFITNHPRHLVPLAKGADGDTARSFQLVVGGIELVKAFAEQNDPFDQRRQFDDQAKRRAAGEADTQVIDEDFLEALEYGMPPAAGFGMGIDRLVALLADQPSLRQVLLFPFMKPRPAAQEEVNHD